MTPKNGESNYGEPADICWQISLPLRAASLELAPRVKLGAHQRPYRGSRLYRRLLTECWIKLQNRSIGYAQ
jgi:hypothetical protein